MQTALLLAGCGAFLHAFGETRAQEHVEQHAPKAKQFEPPKAGLHASYQAATEGQAEHKMHEGIGCSICGRLLSYFASGFFAHFTGLF